MKRAVTERALRRRMTHKIRRESAGYRKFQVARGRTREVARYLVLEGNVIVHGGDDLEAMAEDFGALGADERLSAEDGDVGHADP